MQTPDSIARGSVDLQQQLQELRNALLDFRVGKNDCLVPLGVVGSCSG
jgi:hypothetical protein